VGRLQNGCPKFRQDGLEHSCEGMLKSRNGKLMFYRLRAFRYKPDIILLLVSKSVSGRTSISRRKVEARAMSAQLATSSWHPGRRWMALQPTQLLGSYHRVDFGKRRTKKVYVTCLFPPLWKSRW